MKFENIWIKGGGSDGVSKLVTYVVSRFFCFSSNFKLNNELSILEVDIEKYWATEDIIRLSDILNYILTFNK